MATWGAAPLHLSVQPPPQLQAGAVLAPLRPLHHSIGDDAANRGVQHGGHHADVVLQLNLTCTGVSSLHVNLVGLPLGPHDQGPDIGPWEAITVSGQKVQSPLAPGFESRWRGLEIQPPMIAPRLQVHSEWTPLPSPVLVVPGTSTRRPTAAASTAATTSRSTTSEEATTSSTRVASSPTSAASGHTPSSPRRSTRR